MLELLTIIITYIRNINAIYKVSNKTKEQDIPKHVLKQGCQND